MGRIPFAMLFEKQEDGSYVSHSALNRETWIRLRFFQEDDGRWLLEEAGGLEGLGARGSVLVPAEGDDNIQRWISSDDPRYLRVEMAVEEETLYMKVIIRGKEHAQLNLTRLPEDQLPALRREFAEAAERLPQEESIHDYANVDEVPAAIREARQSVAADPEDAGARLDLAAALGEVIQADSATMGPRYAGEMLQSLLQAVELDPDRPEAYQWLAGYYLNAPPIAGGSLEKAEQAARKLNEIDPQAGQALLALVEQKRGTE
jgi:tetratricopeptide (TPR) repeat protein